MALPFLQVRCVDWVGPVRHGATRVVERWLERSPDGLVEMLPLLEHLLAFRRADASSPVAKALARLTADPEALVTRSLASRDPRVRARALALLAESGLVTPERAVAFLGDRDSTVQARAAMLVEALWTDPLGETAGALAARLVRARSARVRAVGLRMSFRALGPAARPLMVEHLADRNRGVRWIATTELLAREPSFDVAGHLRALVRERPTLGAIEHLTDLRHPEDWELLVPILDGASPAVASAAVRAMRRLDGSASRELRLMLVDDPRPGVSREAVRSMERDLWASDAPIVEGWRASPHAHVRRAAIRLAPRLRG